MQKIFDLLQRRIWLGPLILVLALLLGMGLGLLIGWVIVPVSWTPTADDIRAISDSYALNNDIALARQRLQSVSTPDQVRLFNKVIADSAARNRPIEAERATALAQALPLNLSSGATSANTPVTGSSLPSLGSLSPFLLGGAIIFALALLGAGAFFLIRVGLPRLRAARTSTVSETETETETELGTEPAALIEKPAQVSTAPTAGTLGKVQAVYTAGMDNFDASYPLETAKQGFLGECGIGVSETVGDGLPDKVTAFDLWLFDKTDVRTVTHILMSEYAYNDPGVRAKLQTKGDAILAVKNAVIPLETQSLKIEARVLDLVYATNPSLPSNSYFQKLVVEIATYLK